jgi:PTS system nitrogen regulatory IIA component
LYIDSREKCDVFECGNLSVMKPRTSVNTILSGLKIPDKEQIFKFISGKAGEDTGTDPDKILEMLLESENLNPSGVGDGVAIPHLKLAELSSPYSLFAKLSQSVEFDAVDGQPVDMVYLLISPEQDGPKHLSRLAKVSRMFRSHALCSKLRIADNDNVIRNLIEKPESAININNAA